jgi:hypothetical protein
MVLAPGKLHILGAPTGVLFYRYHGHVKNNNIRQKYSSISLPDHYLGQADGNLGNHVRLLVGNGKTSEGLCSVEKAN